MVSTNLIFLLLCSFISLTNALFECPAANDTFHNARIFLIQARRHSKNAREQIIIYYDHVEYRPGDVIILIQNNTLTAEISFSRYTPTGDSGFFFTKMPLLNLTHDSSSKFITQFQGYCAYWERENIRSKHFCLTSHPQWMYDLRYYIGDKTFKTLLLPGTHQSGSYSKTTDFAITNSFAATQDQCVLQQLIFGARYLDLRPSYVHGVFYNSHGFLLMEEMQIIINDIKIFLDNTQEIVIISFKEFYRGFEKEEVHESFISYLKTNFNRYLFCRTDKLWSTSMDEIWNSKKRLIISYHHNIHKQKEFLWPHIPHKWGNIPPNGDLKKFIVDVQKSGPKPKVTIAAYTFQLSTVWINISKYILGLETVSLHDIGKSVGPSITKWFNELQGHSTCMIAVDYIHATGIVDVTIEWNKRYSSLCVNDYNRMVNIK